MMLRHCWLAQGWQVRCPGWKSDHPFFAKQFKIVRANGGIIDPERIDDYIAIGGYTALHQVLTEMQPAQVVDEVTKSGLRGRGALVFRPG